MNPRLLATVAAVSLAACAAQGPQKPIAPTPVCTGKAQCTAEWAEARTFILQNAAYKIQTYSSDFMQTYNSINEDTGLAAQVNLQPMAGGSYRVVASFSCANIFACVPNQWTTLDRFNRAVAAAGQNDLSAK